MRVAIIGSGVSGLTCAHLLRHEHEVTVLELDSRPGGHAHTRDILFEGRPLRVDTAFIVYNERNYPVFSRMLKELNVTTRPSDMSFSVSDVKANLEWSGSSLSTVFAQRSNLTRPAFLRMLTDIVRFNREAQRLLEGPVDPHQTLGEFLALGHWSQGFLDWYLIPMGAAIWSADPAQITNFPVGTFLRFFDNHGLVGGSDRPEWRTVVGGSRQYVQAITRQLGRQLRLGTSASKIVRRRDGIEIATENGDVETYDHVILATHSDQALRLLSDPTDAEQEILSSIKYRPNIATLHSDERMLPRRKKARASWNWRHDPTVHAPTLTYDLSRLQGLETMTPLCLTLNQPEAINPECVIDTTTYWHPVFDQAAMNAQRRHGEISGRDGISFAGAYWGYGFHEDGARSAVEVCKKLGIVSVRENA
jgi:predicted NAD/FAD-binding protein